jgi:hypothetical protein
MHERKHKLMQHVEEEFSSKLSELNKVLAEVKTLKNNLLSA